MVRFHDSADSMASPELINPTEFQSIKGSEVGSIEEVATYWDDIFESLADDQDVQKIEKDSLLADIFGRHEDEFEFDFEIDEDIQAVLDKFEDARWEQLTKIERIAVIREFADVLSQKLELSNRPEIGFYKGDMEYCGAYKQWDNSIEINSRYFNNPKELVDTIAHEMRHAYQYQRAQLQETQVDLMYKCNFENYISPQKLADGKYLFFTDYQDQFIEAEARAFANLFLKEAIL